MFCNNNSNKQSHWEDCSASARSALSLLSFISNHWLFTRQEKLAEINLSYFYYYYYSIFDFNRISNRWKWKMYRKRQKNLIVKQCQPIQTPIGISQFHQSQYITEHTVLNSTLLANAWICTVLRSGANFVIFLCQIFTLRYVILILIYISVAIICT